MAMADALYDMRLLDDLARKRTPIHMLHPLAKLIATAAFVVAVVSFAKSDIAGLLPLVLYPVILISLAELPSTAVLKRLVIVEPLIIGIGILNPLLDHQTVLVGGMMLSRGWITFASIMFKSALAVTAAIILIATTGMEQLAMSLRMIGIPRILVLQVLLTYRYVAVLIEEVARVLRAYSLRSPGQKGIRRDAWGSLAGQLLLRTFDRGQRVYQAMCLRGFDGEYRVGQDRGLSSSDLTYITVWVLYFTAVRLYNIPLLLGSLMTGVTK